MCIGILYVHADCDHQKKFDCVETCSQYLPDENSCPGSCTVIHTILIREPALCVECFRGVEADIDLRHDQVINTVEREIENCTVALRKEWDRETKQGLKDHRSALFEEIRIMNDARNEEIANFRTKHGVWADG